jgi:hypothetical protein
MHIVLSARPLPERGIGSFHRSKQLRMKAATVTLVIPIPAQEEL